MSFTPRPRLRAGPRLMSARPAGRARRSVPQNARRRRFAERRRRGGCDRRGSLRAREGALRAPPLWTPHEPADSCSPQRSAERKVKTFRRTSPPQRRDAAAHPPAPGAPPLDPRRDPRSLSNGARVSRPPFAGACGGRAWLPPEPAKRANPGANTGRGPGPGPDTRTRTRIPVPRPGARSRRPTPGPESRSRFPAPGPDTRTRTRIPVPRPGARARTR